MSRDPDPNIKKLSIGVSMSIPPWVIKNSDSGIELDILKEAFSYNGITVLPLYMPFARVIQSFEKGKLDGLINAKPGVIDGGYLSEVVVTFQNVAVSLAEKGYPTDIDMSFLEGKSIVAFQRASRFLGDDFASVVRGNKRYQEVSEQSLQLNLLFIRKVDFIVLDKSIFGYFWNRAINGTTDTSIFRDNYKQGIVFHPLFDKSEYSFAFKDERMRDLFNDGLRKLKESGRYAEILDKYDDLKNLYRSLK